MCHAISCTFGFIILKNYIKLDFRPIKCILKPALATIMMVAVSYFAYMNLENVISQKFACLCALAVALVVYVVLIILLKIFDKNEIIMLPYGKKIYEILIKLKIY